MDVKAVQTKGWTNPATTARFWAEMEDAQRRQMAQRILRLRKKNGWSQEELAHKAGVSSKTVSRWENAEVEDPRSSMVAKFALAFGVDREAITGPSLTLDEPEGPLERIERMLNEVLRRLPADAPPAPKGEIGRRIAKPRTTGGGKKRKRPPKAAGGSEDTSR